MAIRLKSREDIEMMRKAGRVVQRVHQLCREMTKPGVTTKEIDDAAGQLIADSGAVGTFKNFPTYRPGEGFPANLCISVNEQVVHGIAGSRQIEDGDVVGVDCGVKLDGWCADAATTILVGNVEPDVRAMCECTQQCLQIAIDNIQPGRRWSYVARLMQEHAEDQGYGVVREFVGHGIGQRMHEEPKVPNFVSRELLRNDIDLVEGLVLAVEPMCTLGTREVQTLHDGWTVVTADRKASAHYEHTLAVTRTGCEILTDGN